ncbi:hypothetical protein [Aliiroseovarius sp. F20344]|nr:hypothetical protein [Aliiroseovarius sp. F20344]MCK0142972.1 hypothetical protein [Aliiroseovarius sp. F20344]
MTVFSNKLGRIGALYEKAVKLDGQNVQFAAFAQEIGFSVAHDMVDQS